MLEDFTRNVGASSKFISGSLGREHLFKYLPASQTELPIRRMSVNALVVIIHIFLIYILFFFLLFRIVLIQQLYH